MASGIRSKFYAVHKRLRIALIGPQTLAFLPALTLGGYWFGGEGMLLFLALVFPAAFAIAGLFSGTGPAWAQAHDRETGLPLRTTAERVLDDILIASPEKGKSTAAFALTIDDFEKVERQFGAKSSAEILKQSADRIVSELREIDKVVRLDGPRFGVALGAVSQVSLETLIQISVRLQEAISEPFSIDATRIFVTASVGFCQVQASTKCSGKALLDRAESALELARISGSGSIRAFKPDSRRSSVVRTIIHNEAAEALEKGQIRPWFQPQVSTDTGEVSGFEALARWNHPDRGIILPADFLPVLAKLNLMDRLSEVMLTKSLSAIRHWDRCAYAIPHIAINFSSQELSNPKLVDRLKWDLDRFELTPQRLSIEILEDVIADSKDDVIVNNIQEIAQLGCNVDLDDFGTGHASIANIRRFAVNRIKIDRSFVTKVDRDRDQQNMVAAILTMAERLEIDTLAEGVETIGEHAILAQLGCGHVQGFSIAKPMPIEDTDKWITNYRGRLPDITKVGRKTS